MRHDTILMRTTLRLGWVLLAVFTVACGGAVLLEWDNDAKPTPRLETAPPVVLPS